MILSVNHSAYSKVREIYPSKDILWYVDLIAREVHQLAAKHFHLTQLESEIKQVKRIPFNDMR